MGTHITFKRPDGNDATAISPTRARRCAGVVVIQNGGLSEQIKGLSTASRWPASMRWRPIFITARWCPITTWTPPAKMNSLDFMDATTQTCAALCST